MDSQRIKSVILKINQLISKSDTSCEDQETRVMISELFNELLSFPRSGIMTAIALTFHLTDLGFKLEFCEQFNNFNSQYYDIIHKIGLEQKSQLKKISSKLISD